MSKIFIFCKRSNMLPPSKVFIQCLLPEISIGSEVSCAARGPAASGTGANRVSFIPITAALNGIRSSIRKLALPAGTHIFCKFDFRIAISMFAV